MCVQVVGGARRCHGDAVEEYEASGDDGGDGQPLHLHPLPAGEPGQKRATQGQGKAFWSKLALNLD